MDFKAFIEIPAGSSVKYEVDEETGKLAVDRFLHGANYYPCNYGYIEGTKGKDGDALDVLVLASQTVIPGVVIKCHAIGVLEMEDEAGVDTKIIAVPDVKVDPIFGTYISIADVHEHTKLMLKDFFDNYKNIEPNKWVKTGGFKDSDAAEKEIEASKV